MLAVAERHRRARVDDEVDGEVLFLLVEADEEALEALVDVPVEVAKIVARLVVAVVGELDAAPALLRAPLGAQAAREDPPADEREVVELPLELVVEELRRLATEEGGARDERASATTTRPMESMARCGSRFPFALSQFAPARAPFSAFASGTHLRMASTT